MVVVFEENEFQNEDKLVIHQPHLLIYGLLLLICDGVNENSATGWMKLKKLMAHHNVDDGDGFGTNSSLLWHFQRNQRITISIGLFLSDNA